MTASSASSDASRFRALLVARHPCVRIVTHEEGEAVSLVKEAAFNEGREIWTWNNVDGAKPAIYEDSQVVESTEHPAAGLVHLRRMGREGLMVLTLDLADHLDDPGVLRATRSLIDHLRSIEGTLVMLDHRDAVPDVIQNEATPFELSLPDENALETLLRKTLREIHERTPLEVEISERQFRVIVRNLRGLSARHARQIITDAVAIDRRIDDDDLNHILAQKRQYLHRDGVLEYVEAPVDMEEIGGLARLKSWLQARRGSFSDDAAAFGLEPPRGVLLLGVQGAGKSLAAKAIATSWGRPLLRLDPGTLYDRYVGESERRLRGALHQAETMAPIVLWIDEIEKGFASAASRSTDGGLSQRMFGRLLTWMQEHEEPVFLAATANNIEALPPELLRKGRFDEIFFVDLPGPDVRRKIFEIHLEKRNRDPENFDLDALVQTSDGYSGAEIEQAVIAALHAAFSREEELTTEHVHEALENSPPLSVTMAEKIRSLREWARDRCVPAD